MGVLDIASKGATNKCECHINLLRVNKFNVIGIMFCYLTEGLWHGTLAQITILESKVAPEGHRDCLSPLGFAINTGQNESRLLFWNFRINGEFFMGRDVM